MLKDHLATFQISSTSTLKTCVKLLRFKMCSFFASLMCRNIQLAFYFIVFFLSFIYVEVLSGRMDQIPKK